MKRKLLSPMIRAIQPNCATSYIWTMATLEIAVERMLDVLCLYEQSSERGGNGITHSAYKIRK